MAAEKEIGKGESLQVRAPAIGLATLGILIVLCMIAFGFVLFFPNRIGVRFVVRHSFPAPAVIPDERALRLSLEARQQRQLQGATGHMPIGKAMETIAGKGPRAFDPVGR